MAASAQPLARPEIPALTSLRFFAALWVVLFHIREIGLWKGGIAPYVATIKLGYLGVSFFFVLSGFILVYVYVGREIPKGRFWQARFARIYPAYAFSLLITAPMLVFSRHYMAQMHVSPSLVYFAFPLLLEAWVPQTIFFWNIVAWSLSVEVFFYAVFPWAMRLLQRCSARALGLWIAGSWLLSLAFTLGYFVLRPDGAAWPNSQDNLLPWLAVIKFNPIVRLPEFLLGMGTGLAFLRAHSPAEAGTQPGASPVAQTQPSTWAVLAGLVLLILGILLQRIVPYPVMHSGLLAPAFALLIYGFATQPAWTRLLAAKPFLLLGEASYSLYLLHAFPLGALVFGMHVDRSPHIALVLAVYFAAMLLVSIGVFLGIENPLRRLLRPHRRIKPLQPAIAT